MNVTLVFIETTSILKVRFAVLLYFIVCVCVLIITEAPGLQYYSNTTLCKWPVQACTEILLWWYIYIFNMYCDSHSWVSAVCRRASAQSFCTNLKFKKQQKIVKKDSDFPNNIQYVEMQSSEWSYSRKGKKTTSVPKLAFNYTVLSDRLIWWSFLPEHSLQNLQCNLISVTCCRWNVLVHL